MDQRIGRAYYNEHDPYAAQWLRNLIAAGLIADGYVDERSIEDVHSADLVGFTQWHFFAGIGIWSHSLRQAGISDETPACTASCPCQPFSQGGKGEGFTDERHLWPALLHLIKHAIPADVPIFGEQVASKDGLAWLDLVQADMEEEDYAFWPFDLCAAGVGAPNIRQRLFFVGKRVGDTVDKRPQGEFVGSGQDRSKIHRSEGKTIIRRGNTCSMADTKCSREQRDSGDYEEEKRSAEVTRFKDRDIDDTVNKKQDYQHRSPGTSKSRWYDADWLFCTDRKWRPVEPGTFPLAHGYPQRVGRLRAFGNAINAEVAIEYITAVKETFPEWF